MPLSQFWAGIVPQQPRISPLALHQDKTTATATVEWLY
jgi:hypothetical protein